MADNPKRCFVISPIGDAGSVERKHADMTLNAIIRPALNESGTTFEVNRGDESPDIGMITDHLIAEIMGSDLIVADLSFLNQNVFYELGIAHSEEKPVIHIAHRETKLPFDNVGYRTVMFDLGDWDSHVEAKKQIAEAARKTLAPGFVISNPVTHARGVGKLKTSADPKEAIVANLVEGMAAFKKTWRSLKEKWISSLLPTEQREFPPLVPPPLCPPPHRKKSLRKHGAGARPSSETPALKADSTKHAASMLSRAREESTAHTNAREKLQFAISEGTMTLRQTRKDASGLFNGEDIRLWGCRICFYCSDILVSLSLWQVTANAPVLGSDS